MRSANADSTSYGVARLPKTKRLAKCRARSRIGWNDTATTAVAAIDRKTLLFEPMAVPMPTTAPTYTAVTNAARSP